MLLQNLYQAFDEIAKKRKVFKVETIGDSYVACAGVPEAEPAHAIKIVRFAWDCMVRMKEVTRKLGKLSSDAFMTVTEYVPSIANTSNVL